VLEGNNPRFPWKPSTTMLTYRLTGTTEAFGDQPRRTDTFSPRRPALTRPGTHLTNLPALREVGFTANRRLLGVQRLDHDPITGTTALATVTGPVTTDTGTRVPGLRLGQQRSHALLSALVTFRLQPPGFTNKDLRAITAELRALPAGAPSTGQMTYDLRRLRLHGLIERVPHTHRYRVTDAGLHTAMFLTRVHDRLLPTGLAHLGNPRNDGTLCSASTAYQRAIDALAHHNGLAA